MSDLRRQLASARNERDRLRAENQGFRMILGDIPGEYALAFSALCDIAYHGIRRPDDLGGPIDNGHSSSRPPAYHPAAYHMRNEERRELRKRAETIMRNVEKLVDDGPTVVGPPRIAETA